MPTQRIPTLLSSLGWLAVVISVPTRSSAVCARSLPRRWRMLCHIIVAMEQSHPSRLLPSWTTRPSLQITRGVSWMARYRRRLVQSAMIFQIEPLTPTIPPALDYWKQLKRRSRLCLVHPRWTRCRSAGDSHEDHLLPRQPRSEKSQYRRPPDIPLPVRWKFLEHLSFVLVQCLPQFRAAVAFRYPQRIPGSLYEV